MSFSSPDDFLKLNEQHEAVQRALAQAERYEAEHQLRRAYFEIKSVFTRYFSATDSTHSTQPYRYDLMEALRELEAHAADQIQAARDALQKLHLRFENWNISPEEYTMRAHRALSLWENALLSDSPDHSLQRERKAVYANIEKKRVEKDVQNVINACQKLIERGEDEEQLGKKSMRVIIDEYYQKAHDSAKLAHDRYPDQAALIHFLDEVAEKLSQKQKEYQIKTSMTAQGQWDELIALYEQKADDAFDNMIDADGNIIGRARVSEIRERIYDFAERWAQQEIHKASLDVRHLLEEMPPSPRAALNRLGDGDRWRRWLRSASDLERLERLIGTVKQDVDLLEGAESELEKGRLAQEDGQLGLAWQAYQRGYDLYPYYSELRTFKYILTEETVLSLKSKREQANQQFQMMEFESALNLLERHLSIFPDAVLSMEDVLVREVAQIDSLKAKILAAREQLRNLPERLQALAGAADSGSSLDEFQANFGEVLALLEVNLAGSYSSHWEQYQDLRERIRAAEGIHVQIRYLQNALESDDLLAVESVIKLANEIDHDLISAEQSQRVEQLTRQARGHWLFLRGKAYFETGNYESAEQDLRQISYPPDQNQADLLLNQIVVLRTREHIEQQRFAEAEKRLAEGLPKEAWEIGIALKFVNMGYQAQRDQLLLKARHQWYEQVLSRLRGFVDNPELENIQNIQADLADLRDYLSDFDEQAYERWHKAIDPLIAIDYAQQAPLNDLEEARRRWRIALDKAQTPNQRRICETALRALDIKAGEVLFQIGMNAEGHFKKDQIENAISKLMQLAKQRVDVYEFYLWSSQLLSLIATRVKDLPAREKDAYALRAYLDAQTAYQKYERYGGGSQSLVEKQLVEKQLKESMLLKDIMPTVIKLENYLAAERTIDEFQLAFRVWDRLQEQHLPESISAWWTALIAQIEAAARSDLRSLEQERLKGNTPKLAKDHVNSIARLLILAPQDKQATSLIKLLPGQASKLRERALQSQRAIQAGYAFEGQTGAVILQNQVETIENLEKEVRLVDYLASLVEEQSHEFDLVEEVAIHLRIARDVLADILFKLKDFQRKMDYVQSLLEGGYKDVRLLEEASLFLDELVMGDFIRFHPLLKEQQEALATIQHKRMEHQDLLAVFHTYLAEEEFDLAEKVLDRLADIYDEFETEPLSFTPQWSAKGDPQPVRGFEAIRAYIKQHGEALARVFEWGRVLGEESGVPNAYLAVSDWEVEQVDLRKLAFQGEFDLLEDRLAWLCADHDLEGGLFSYRDMVLYLSYPPLGLPDGDLSGNWQLFWHEQQISHIHERYKYAIERGGCKRAVGVLEFAYDQHIIYQTLVGRLRPKGDLYQALFYQRKKHFQEHRRKFQASITALERLLDSINFWNRARKLEQIENMVLACEQAISDLFSEAGCPEYRDQDRFRKHEVLQLARAKLS